MKLPISRYVTRCICAVLAIAALVTYAQQIISEKQAISTAFRLVNKSSATSFSLVSAKAIFHEKAEAPNWLALMTRADDERFLKAVHGRKYWVVHLKVDENPSSERLSIVTGTTVILDAESGEQIFWNR